ncbi:MAG: hypothetical protein ACXVXS_10050, partial [Blastococcus sp.]
FAWIDTFNAGFSIWALLGTVVALAIALFAVLTLLPELSNRPALPGGVANAAQWANQQAPEFGRQQGQAGPGQPGAPPAGPPPSAPPGYAPPQYAPPPPPAAAPPAAPPAGGTPGGPSGPAEHPGSA